MISSRCDIHDFFESVRKANWYEALVACEKEATEAERLAVLRPEGDDDGSFCQDIARYALALKHAIFSLRYGARPSGLDPEVFALCSAIRQSDSRFLN